MSTMVPVLRCLTEISGVCTRVFRTLFVLGGNPRWLPVLGVVVFLLQSVFCDDYKASSVNLYTAIVNITYRDPVTGEMRSEREEFGRYGTVSRLDSESGLVIHVRTSDNKTHGCSPPTNVPKERWIALIERGSCKFHQKIHNAAIIKNASAVVIYNHKAEDDLLTMEHKVDDVVSIFISKADGERIRHLVDNGTRVWMHISIGKPHQNRYSSINKTSVLFVSISFIVLMIISLAWLVFYYIQRFRYAHAKERLAKRLMNAAKKAIGKMPLRTVKSGDRETESDFDQCAICIESYKSSDVLRILPCKHLFHKSCVDPWLIEQRSCPICKLDILKAYGLQIHGSCDSVANIDVEVPSTSIGPSEMAIPESGRDLEPHSVHMVRYQPASVEHHNVPAAPGSIEEEGEGAIGVGAGEPEGVSSGVTSPICPVPLDSSDPLEPSDSCTAPMIPTHSMESVRSLEFDSNELQLLMPHKDCVDNVHDHQTDNT